MGMSSPASTRKCIVPADVAASVVLVGFESVGKSALFRGLTGHATGDEANFRGSTVICRRCHLEECECEGDQNRED